MPRARVHGALHALTRLIPLSLWVLVYPLTLGAMLVVESHGADARALILLVPMLPSGAVALLVWLLCAATLAVDVYDGLVVKRAMREP